MRIIFQDELRVSSCRGGCPRAERSGLPHKVTRADVLCEIYSLAVLTAFELAIILGRALRM
jgi:hypothetical protein